MKAIIEIISRTYTKSDVIDANGMKHIGFVKKSAETKETKIFGLPVRTEYEVDGKGRIIKFLGIPLKSCHSELWDYRPVKTI